MPAQRRVLGAQGRKTVRRLLEAGLAEFGTRGVHAVSVDDVVRRGQTSHGTFYLYFSNKDDLFKALLRDALHEMKIITDEFPVVTRNEAGRAALRGWVQRFCGIYLAIITGIGTAFAFIPVSVAALAGTARHEAGLASGLLNTSQQLGGAIGVAIASTIAATRATTLLHHGAAPAAALTGGFQWAFWACGLIGLAAVPVTFLLVRRGELATAVASTTVREPKPAPVTAG
jgi:AcrR family transcriptional regulator